MHIKFDENNFSVRQSKISLWIYRFEMSIYFISFFFVIYLIYAKSVSEIGVKILVIGLLTTAFLIVIFKKLRSLWGNDFLLSRIKDGFKINNKIKTSKVDMGAIEIKEMVSTYSAVGYYDISIKVNNKKIPIAFGVTEKDKTTILEGLEFFLSSVGSVL